MSHLIGSISPSFLITQKFLCFGSLSSRHLECVQWTRKAKGRHRFFFFQCEQNEIYRNSFIHTILEWVFSHVQASLVAQMVKNLPAMQETWVWSLVWENPLEETPPFQYSWPEEFHGRRARRATVHGVEESDTTEWLAHTGFSLPVLLLLFLSFFSCALPAYILSIFVVSTYLPWALVFRLWPLLL